MVDFMDKLLPVELRLKRRPDDGLILLSLAHANCQVRVIVRAVNNICFIIIDSLSLKRLLFGNCAIDSICRGVASDY